MPSPTPSLSSPTFISPYTLSSARSVSTTLLLSPNPRVQPTESHTIFQSAIWSAAAPLPLFSAMSTTPLLGRLNREKNNFHLPLSKAPRTHSAKQKQHQIEILTMHRPSLAYKPLVPTDQTLYRDRHCFPTS